MKVLLINGSPREQSCTATALREVASELERAGIETELFQVGKEPVRGCIACGYCKSHGRCAFEGDGVNSVIEKAREAQGILLGSPVHYAAASGAATSLFDRAFYAGKANFEYKPGAAVVSCRRGGAASTLDQLNKYFTISNMPVVSSQYWNMVHGNAPEEVLRDEEGMQTMRTLGRNMAWLLRCIEVGAAAGFGYPEPEPVVRTNFIR